MPTGLIELVERLPRARVVLVGDLMLDRYVFGNAERLSPEAPVPVLHFQREEFRLGGAGGVAAMLAAGLTEYNFGDSEFLMLLLVIITLPFAANRDGGLPS